MTDKIQNATPNASGMAAPALSFGLDIGIASVGWAVLAPDRIVALGVRCFDKAETADKGEPLNLTRRQARLMRRRLWRRQWRLTRLARLLKQEGLIADAEYFRQTPAFSDSTWRLRAQGLDRRLEPVEWARVIYHICKHRGFHWLSRAEEAQAEGDSKSEGGKVKKGLAATTELMRTKGYRTAAEMVLAEFPGAQRNKRGQYDKALSRALLDDEMRLLFERQRTFGNPHAGDAFEAKIRDRKTGLLWQQRPPLSGANLLKMLGRCTFERTGGPDGKGEFRAPKASFSAERHVWLTRLNNLRLSSDGSTRPLTDAERRVALHLPYQSGERFTYKSLKNGLVKAGLIDDSVRFAGLAYPSALQQEAGKAKNPEDAVLVKLTGWHEVRMTLRKAGLDDVWQQLSVAALDGKPEQLDQIAWVLSVYKDDDEARAALEKLALPGGSQTVEALLGIRFDKFSNLSLKALRKIVPHMEAGLRYDEACTAAGYNHSMPSLAYASQGAKTPYLPPFYLGRDPRKGSMKLRDDMDVPRNPVVLRALNQARKVVNALVRTYGSPNEVHIEMARDLSRPIEERREIEKEQQKYRDRNEQARQQFEADFGYRPTAAQFEKWLLYREQQGKCAYSLEALDIDRVLNDLSYAQVDHVLPYSRSYDDSKNNKVLVKTSENQNKGNRTPYEYLGGTSNSERWRNFVAWVEQNKSYRLAKRNRLLRKDFGAEQAEGFRERNLNDTRYICRFFKNYVEQNLQLAADSTSKRCVVLNGQLTAFLRARWGLTKIREESDRHHALDAAVVAACSHAMVKRLADYSRRKELEFLREGFVDPETGEILNPEAHAMLEKSFPWPWPHFRDELMLRLKEDDPAKLREGLARLGSYPAAELQRVKTLFVSRAPQRRNSGAAHKDTIYAARPTADHPNRVVQRVSLTSLTLKDIPNLVDPDRNVALYEAIRARLEAFGGKADKAFSDENPLHKPDRHGNPTGPIVRSVKLAIDNLSGIEVRGGIVKNDSMIRVDVFQSKRDRRYHLVPVYVHHRVKGLPNRAIVGGRDEDGWTVMDESFEFLFSLSSNDLLRVRLRAAEYLGYFAGCDRSTSAIHVWVHDRASHIGKDGLIRSIGVRTALLLEKLHVDVLGNVYPAPPETRRGLA